MHPPYPAFAPGSSWMPNQSTNARGVLAPHTMWGGKKEPPSAVPEQWGVYPGFWGRACTCAPLHVKLWQRRSRERAVLYCRRRKLRRRGGSTCKIPQARHPRSLHQGFGCVLPCGHVCVPGQNLWELREGCALPGFSNPSDGDLLFPPSL